MRAGELIERYSKGERDFIEANLYGADLNRANLYKADLRGADLSGADLNRANLYKADLRGADLSGADLSGADLSEADLRLADLRLADLRGSNLYNTKGITYIQTQPYPIYISDRNVQIGCMHKQAKEWLSIKPKYGGFVDGWGSHVDLWDISIKNFKKLKNLLVAGLRSHYDLNKKMRIKDLISFLKEKNEL